MTPEPPDADTTGVVPNIQLRLSDFAHGEPPLPAAILLVVSGEARGAVLSATDLPATVGRAQGVDLLIEDPSVSRQHAVLREDDDGCLQVEDLGSSNGSTMNGNPISGPMRLVDGDLVGFGSSTVLVKLVS